MINDNFVFQFKAQWVSNQSNVTPKEFYNDVVYSQEDVVLNVLFNLIKPINGDKNPRVREGIWWASTEWLHKIELWKWNYSDCCFGDEMS